MGCSRSRNCPSNFSTRFGTTRRTRKSHNPAVCGGLAEKNDWREDTSGEQSVFDVFDNLTNDSKNGYYKDVKRWIDENGDLFARAWLDGYEVGKEKRYKVVMPNVSSSGGVLTRIKHNDSWIWIDTLGTIVEGRTHTRKELEDAGFGWVFDCPGVEVEEVEE